MLFQWFRLDSPSLWIFAYFPQHGFNGLCSFLSTATLSTIDSRRRWLVLGAGGLRAHFLLLVSLCDWARGREFSTINGATHCR